MNTRLDNILSKARVVIESIQNTEPRSDIVCENDVCRIIRKEQTVSNEATTSVDKMETNELTPEEKIERAKELIGEERREKEREAKEAERLKEIERRKVGQGVQEHRRWQKGQNETTIRR